MHNKFYGDKSIPEEPAKKFLIVANTFVEAQKWFQEQKENYSHTSDEFHYANITSHVIVTKDSGLDKLKGIIPDKIYFVGNPMICYYMWQEILQVEERIKRK